MNKKISFKRVIGIVLAVLVVAAAALFVAFRIYTSDYYAADTDAIEEIAALCQAVHHADSYTPTGS